MEKKYQIIYIWSFIIISGIILLLLYTPLGGDLHYAAYSEQSRYAVSPGVNFDRQVGNFSGGSSSGGSYNYAPSQQAYVSPSFQNGGGSNFSGGNSLNNNSNYSGGNLALSSNKIKSFGASSSGGAVGGMAAVSRKSGTEVNSTLSGGGVDGSLFNSTAINDGGVMQRAGEEDPPLDPGGDPTQPPLPIGNEIGALLFFAGIFTIYKWLRLSRK